MSAPDPLARWRSAFPILEKTTYLVSNSLGAMPGETSSALAGYTETWIERPALAT